MATLFAILSMTLFSTANIAINRGYDGKTQSAGAFLSILITCGFSLAIWAALGLHDGWSRMTREGVAWFALAGVLTVFFGRVFLYASIQYLGAVRASAVKRLNPFFSVLLGVLLLGEVVAGSALWGMLLIAASFALLIREDLRSPAAAGTGARRRLERIVFLGYVYGPLAAFAYASGYVARKQGLLVLPDPLLGTLIGALAGIVVFVIAAGFLKNYRDDLRQTFTGCNPWLLLGGVLSSSGQICYFVALNHGTVSRIALITSMEVFLTIFLSMVIFRSRERVTQQVLLAAGLGVLGTALVILG
jgi:uncharacterized membrane protein